MVDVFAYALLEDNPVSPISPTSVSLPQVMKPQELQDALDSESYTEERELLDAMNLVVRGDYTGAVRRAATSDEVILESVLRRELLKQFDAVEVERKLRKSQSDFPGRLERYQRLSGRQLDAGLAAELGVLRRVRRDIVHRGRRLSLADRDEARRLVSVGRAVFEWLEKDPARHDARQRGLDLDTLQREKGPFSGDITSEGVRIRLG